MEKSILKKILVRIDEKNSWGKLELRAMLLELLLDEAIETGVKYWGPG